MYFVPNISCKACIGSRIIEEGSDWVCIDCGLVAKQGLFTEDPEWREFAEEAEPYVDHTRVKGRVNNPITIAEQQQPKNNNKNDHEWTQWIADLTKLPEQVCQNGLRMLTQYMSDHQRQLKGYNRKCTLAACVYYAQHEMNGGSRTKREFCEATQLDRHVFLKACSDIKAFLIKKRQAKLVHHQDQIYNQINRLLNHMRLFADFDESQIRKAMHAINMRVATDNRLASFSSDKLNVGIMFVAFKMKQVKVKMKTIAEEFHTSAATIIKIERIIQDILMSRR